MIATPRNLQRLRRQNDAEWQRLCGFRHSYRRTFSSILERARSNVIRTWQEFAEQVIRIPEGKYKGERYRADNQPFARVVMRAFDNPDVNTFVGLGCVQSGKSFLFFVLPVLYYAFERKESVIIAAPTMSLAKKKWEKEIMPVIKAQPELLRWMPEKGPGSGGGTPDMMLLGNGGSIEFMAAGGGDEMRSSSTARIVVVTEIDKMDEAGNVSRETDPISQLISRTASFGDNRRVFLECTVSIQEGRIWQEHQEGSTGEIQCPCKHCAEYVRIERADFVGFERENVVAARRDASFFCPKCGEGINDKARHWMQERAVLVHRGQSVTKSGKIVGDFPETMTMSIRWNAFDNRFWSQKYIASGSFQLYKAEQDDSEHAESYSKRETQFVWVKPFIPDLLEDFELDRTVIRQRIDDAYTEGIIPDDTLHVAVGCDIGKWTCNYVVLALRKNNTIHIPAYGEFKSPKVDDNERQGKRQKLSLALLDSLGHFSRQLERGFVIHGSKDRWVPGKIWIDCGWDTLTVKTFCSQMRQQLGERRLASRYRAATGRSRRRVKFVGPAGGFHAPTKRSNLIREIGNNWYGKIERANGVNIMQVIWNSDYYKYEWQNWLAVDQGLPSSVSFYESGKKTAKGEDLTHDRIAKQFTNEKLVRDENGKEDWDKNGSNHYLDAAAMGLGALLGLRDDAARRVQLGRQPIPPIIIEHEHATAG